ncbi:winged helix-turn-helix domain-containing protein [Nocardioides sp. CFH 31398]|uniref:winged helix-turn-helix domain-containing protein n=1 Tax=Nocardioides sp. CFH 31398 TaxID=2919579 RepID=UPI0035AC0003
MSGSHCDHCDLPLAQCGHGRSVPASPAVVARAKSNSSANRRSGRRPQGVRTSRLTPQSEFRPVILDILRERGGRLSVEELTSELESRMQDAFTDGDYGLVDNNEVRWRNAVRWERKKMVDEGLIMPSRERGVWELSAKGRS